MPSHQETAIKRELASGGKTPLPKARREHLENVLSALHPENALESQAAVEAALDTGDDE